MPGKISDSGTLNLDDPSAEVCQLPGTKGPSDCLLKTDDGDPLKW
jgi:hypothetical protein